MLSTVLMEIFYRKVNLHNLQIFKHLKMEKIGLILRILITSMKFLNNGTYFKVK